MKKHYSLDNNNTYCGITNSKSNTDEILNVNCINCIRIMINFGEIDFED